LLRDAALISCPPAQPDGGIAFTGLSWAGCEYLDSVRDPEVWHKTKETANAVGGFTLDLLKKLAEGLIKMQIKKHTGIEL
jgi:hypothetical protein